MWDHLCNEFDRKPPLLILFLEEFDVKDHKNDFSKLTKGHLNPVVNPTNT